MPHEFDKPEEEVRPAGWLGAEELQRLLTELEGVGDATALESQDAPDDWVTVEAVAEATNRSTAEVHEALEKLRSEDAEHRLSLALRELEEPLHRVERPGHSNPDPLAQHFRIPRGQSLSPLLDDLARRSKIASKLSRRIRSKSSDEPRFDLVSLLIMALFTAVTLGAVYYGILQLLK